MASTTPNITATYSNRSLDSDDTPADRHVSIPNQSNTRRRRRPTQTTMLISPSPENDTDSWGNGWTAREEPTYSPSARPHLDKKTSDIPIASSSKAAELTVAPYLTNNVPQTYNPLNGANSPDTKPNTKYCNRHRPDIKCRRQANEESMDLLQRDLATLSNSDQQGISHVWSLFSAAPAKQRNLMLRGILSVCCFPQLSYISSSIQELIKIDFLSMLPPELGFKILCSLDTTSLCKAAQVSRRWRTLADDDVVWHRMCEQHIDRKCTRCGWGLPLMDRKRLRTEKRQIQLRASGRGLNEWSPNITPLPESRTHSRATSVEPAGAASPGKRARYIESDATILQKAKRACTLPVHSHVPQQQVVTKRPWKDVYKARFKVGTNWKYGRCSTRVLRGHTNGVMCLQFNDNILATGSYDGTVKIWDIDSGEVLRTLTGHTAGIRCLQFDDTKLMSGSMDGTIRIWNWRTGECPRVMPSQRGGVISLHFDAPFLACGTMESAIRVWSTCDNSTFTLKGHTDFVNAVKIDAASRTLFSASDDLTIKLWDLDTRQCIRTFDGHVGQVQQVLPLPPEFEFDEDNLGKSSDQDTDIEHDGDEARSDSPSQQRHQHNEDQRQHHLPIAALPLISSLHTARTFPADQGRPEPARYMLTGALDSTIRLWHVPTGRCLRTFFGHLEGIWALAADTLRVVSGAEDSLVKVWDARTGVCERTFVGHAGPVTCIGLSGERLVSGGEDGEVRILEFHTDTEGR